ncbi:recombination regulator RecX [Halalkalibacter akibai]|uniref:Regulatory protein RecX n=1 Tax=Halalkalibacter akibai (strain ATCC 43226 / DSM 21942 / CIP 109018 / JCM 9157 / 1139) TaxID=1236973 RepID=W4QW90_HALA3|nr:recombination regulator RecX [Halalkalibacter akibai]GAE36400.1 regulatory protein RecX [Halalkalibacter akibai JCM 9157]
MAVISKITVQKKNKSRYNLFLSRGRGEEYALSVDEDLLLKHGLKKGLELDEEKLIQLINEDEKKKAYFLAINFLSYRMRSVDEIRVYLRKKEKEEQHIDEVIKELLEKKLLDDQEFASSYVRSKQLTVLKGPMKLKQELIQKGVQESVIERALEQFTKSDQIEAMVKWLEKQNTTSAKKSNQALKEKLSIQLQSKGFSRDAIKEAVRQVDLENDKEEEWEAICFQGDKVKRKLEGKYPDWEFKQRVKQNLYRKGFPMDLIERYINSIDQLE